MKTNQAYISSTLFFPNSKVVIDPNIFSVGLIAYDNLFVDLNLENLPWWAAETYNNLSKGNMSALNKNVEKWKNEIIDFSQMNLARFLGGNPKVLKLISTKLQNIREHPSSEIREFFYLSFESMRGKGTQAFHPFLLPLLTDYFTKKLHFDWDDVLDRQLSFVLAQEVFVCSILSRNFDFDIIYTLNDIEFRMAIQRMSTIPIDLGESISKFANSDIKFKFEPMVIQKYVQSKTIQSMLRGQQAKKRKVKDIELLLELSAPNFSDTPIYEIARLKSKDKLKSIAQIAEEIRAQSKGTSSIEFAKIFSDYLWRVGKILSPSIKDIIIGVLGEIPTPIPINPIGILSSMNDIQQFIKFENKYQWFISISELRKHVEH